MYLDKFVASNLLSKDGGFALDLGCGNGRDSKFLINLGYEVVSVDKETSFPDAIVADIRNFYIEPKKYSFITCNNVLPFFTSKEEVFDMILKMIAGLKEGGILYFTLFGKNSDIKVPTYFTYQEVEEFFDSHNIKVYEKFTREGPSTSMKGLPIHSHIHAFTIRK